VKSPKQQIITEAQYATDICALLIALFVSVANTSAKFAGYSLVEFFLMRFSLLNVASVLVLILLWVFLFRQNGLYQRPAGNVLSEVFRIGAASGIFVAAITLGKEFYYISAIDHGFVTWFWPCSFALTWAFRKVLEGLLLRVHLGDHNVSNVLIVGTNDQAADVAKELRGDQLQSYKCIGYVSAGERGANKVPEGEVVSDLENAYQLMNDQVVDELIVVLTMRNITTQVEDLMRHAAQLGISVRCPVGKLFDGVFGHEALRLSTEQYKTSDGRNDSYLVLNSGYGFNWQYVSKRLFDYTVALCLLLLMTPLMLAAALAISTTSKGGMFFVQKRYGYNGRVIRLFKFRTMSQGADALQKKLREEHNEMDGGAFKMKDDPRVTAVGSFLRKTSIDELPQLFNVLRGEMSLVGPRPLPLADYEHFKKVSHMRRLSVLPGITCTWQASGRNNVSFDEWMELDMAYIDGWSFMTDMNILLKTIPAVLFGRGAS